MLLHKKQLAGVAIPKIAFSDETSVSVVINNLKSGLVYLFRNSILRSILVIGLTYYFVVGLGNSLLLPFSSNVLGASEFQYGIQEGLTSIGFVIGSLLMARFSDRLRDGIWIIISLFGMGTCYLLYAFSTSIPLAIFIIAISGMLNAPYGVARRTLVQRNTDRELRGRVSGAYMSLFHVMMLLGMTAAGLADRFGVRMLMKVDSLLFLVVGGIALLAPGIGRPAADWLRSLALLRQAAAGKGRALGTGRPAVLRIWIAWLDICQPSLPSLLGCARRCSRTCAW